jgi:uncharacterized protein YcaQ
MKQRETSIDDLRRMAIARSLFAPTTLPEAMRTLGFVQADPIRAPARAQDLTLRHRVAGYRAGDLDRAYASLDVEEDFFVNYGFVTRSVHALMHPRARTYGWSSRRPSKVRDVLAFVRERGEVHPREVDDHFAHGSVTNYWGGSSNATTHLLDDMHYRGLLRVVRRDAGIRVYAVHAHDVGPADAAGRRGHIDALVDVAVRKYAPVPSRTLSWLVARLRVAVPQWRGELTGSLARARRRLPHVRTGQTDWYWTEDMAPTVDATQDAVRLLAPFDPLVWDRTRFELFWGWPYRFEAYTPAPKRKHGYYALPLLWRDRVIGWANVSAVPRGLEVELGYATGRAPRERAFRSALELEIDRMRAFLGLTSSRPS